LFLGAAAGAIASGKLMIPTDNTTAAGFTVGWITPLTVFTGFYAVAMCAYLAAVFLTREARVIDDEPLTTLWKQRALSTGLWMGLLSLAGLVMVAIDAPLLTEGFLRRGWPLILVSLVCGVLSLVDVWRLKCTRAVIAAAGAVTAVIWGWGISQYPAIIPPDITASSARAPANVLWIMLAVIGTGAVFLLPALGYLFVLFKSQQAADET
jgi:cytochrome d ubiquinol oxidase subunit II